MKVIDIMRLGVIKSSFDAKDRVASRDKDSY